MRTCRQPLSAAPLIASQGKPVVAKGYGYANVGWQIPNTTTTKFRMGSITKQLQAVADWDDLNPREFAAETDGGRDPRCCECCARQNHQSGESSATSDPR